MKLRTWLVYILTFATDLLCALFALCLGLFGADSYRFEKPPDGPGLYVLTCDVPFLFGRYSAITIAPHVILYRRGRRLPNGWSRIQAHEHRHTEQYEGAGLLASLMALYGFLWGFHVWPAMFVWVVGPWAYMGAGYVVAWLRGEDPYRGSHNEEAAYALAPEDDD